MTASPGASSSTRSPSGSASSTRRAVAMSSTSRYTEPACPMSSVDRPGGDQLTLVHHDRVRADLLDLGEHVAREQHCRAGFRRPGARAGAPRASHRGRARWSARRARAPRAVPSSTRASPSRCRMPCEYVFTLRSTAEPRSAIASAVLDVGVGPACRRRPPTTAAGSACPDRCGTNAGGLDRARRPGAADRSRDGPSHRRAAPRPPWAGSSPRSMRRHVVLPAPFGPSRPHTCPRSTAKRQVVDREHARAEALRQAR